MPMALIIMHYLCETVTGVLDGCHKYPIMTDYPKKSWVLSEFVKKCRLLLCSNIPAMTPLASEWPFFQSARLNMYQKWERKIVKRCVNDWNEHENVLFNRFMKDTANEINRSCPAKCERPN